jgi:hypothetical protein
MGFARIGMLECWKNGKMGLGIMGDWFISNTHFHNKENKSISTDKQIFHHSTIPLFHLQKKTIASKAFYFFE